MVESFLTQPAIFAVVVSLVFGIIATLIGLVYRESRRAIQRVDSEASELSGRVETLERRLSALFTWAFGNPEDDADHGITLDVDEGFQNLEQKLEKIEHKDDERHREVVAQLRALVLSLHDEEALDFDREDVDVEYVTPDPPEHVDDDE